MSGGAHEPGDLCTQAAAVRRGDSDARAELSRSWQRIAEREPQVGAFLHLARDAANAEAERQDLARRRGEPLGPLAGVPIAIKDSLCTLDAPTTCGSRLLAGFRPSYDASAVARLREAGALLLGKTNLDEFGMGSSCEHSALGVTRNPWDLQRVPGGSSGGSAAAIAAGLVHGALGSDTGGSVRQPAALCGVYGLKPSYGRVPRHGLLAYASSLDTVGPMANSVRGAAQLLELIAGADGFDATSLLSAKGDWLRACDPARGRALRVGVLRDWIDQVHSDALRTRIEQALDALRAQGATLIDVRWPGAAHALASYYVLASAEASANLARYDGLRFGAAGEGATLREQLVNARSQGFGDEVKQRILLGTYVLCAGQYQAYYARAQQAQAALRRELHALWARCDVLLGPVTAEPATRLGTHDGDAISMYSTDLFTLPASLAGVPAASCPLGLLPASDAAPALPAALQVIGRAEREDDVLAFSALVESLYPPLPAAPLKANACHTQ